MFYCLTCLNCSSKLQFCWELTFCWTGLLLCWEDGVVGWEGGQDGAVWITLGGLGRDPLSGEKVVWGGWKPGIPRTEPAVNGTRTCPPRPAKSDCEFARKSLCLLKASRAGRGGRLARIDLGSNSFSSLLPFISSLIKWQASWSGGIYIIITGSFLSGFLSVRLSVYKKGIDANIQLSIYTFDPIIRIFESFARLWSSFGSNKTKIVKVISFYMIFKIN